MEGQNYLKKLFKFIYAEFDIIAIVQKYMN